MDSTSWKEIQSSPSSPLALKKKEEVCDAFMKRILPSFLLSFDRLIRKIKEKVLEDHPAEPGQIDKVKELVDKHLTAEKLQTVLRQCLISFYHVLKAGFLLRESAKGHTSQVKEQ